MPTAHTATVLMMLMLTDVGYQSARSAVFRVDMEAGVGAAKVQSGNVRPL
jgi:hypothetical protein